MIWAMTLAYLPLWYWAISEVRQTVIKNKHGPILFREKAKNPIYWDDNMC